MSPALPHTGGAYSFARTAFGPWGGFITGIAENIEYVLTPAVIVFFIGSYLTAIFGTPDCVPAGAGGSSATSSSSGSTCAASQLSFKVTVIVTLLAHRDSGLLLRQRAIPAFDFGKWAMNIGVGPDGAAVELPDGHGPFLPFGVHGVLAALPFAVWLFLAIEQLPLAAEELVDPKRDMPKGIMLGMFTLIALGFLVLIINPAIPRGGSFALRHARASRSSTASARSTAAGWAKILSLFAVAGLVASFHAIIFAYGRQIYSLSRAGYFPHFLSVTHGDAQDAEHRADRRRRGRLRGDAGGVVRHGRRGGGHLHRRRAAQHGGVRRHVLLPAAGADVHPAAPPLPEYRAALSQPVRRPRRVADGASSRS